MIRKLVGTMIEVGLGQFSVEDGVALLKAGKSYGAPKAVAPAGLTLMAIRRKEE
jgi:tRNA U38,U39,U40 pseudouridine synthase TruA